MAAGEAQSYTTTVILEQVSLKGCSWQKYVDPSIRGFYQCRCPETRVLFRDMYSMYASSKPAVESPSQFTGTIPDERNIEVVIH